jgi:hypothetical protein
MIRDNRCPFCGSMKDTQCKSSSATMPTYLCFRCGFTWGIVKSEEGELICASGADLRGGL